MKILHSSDKIFRKNSIERKVIVGKPLQFNENPYQTSLISGLTSLGVELVDSGLDSILKSHLTGEKIFDVVHLDWLHLYYQSRHSVTSKLRFLSFVSKLFLLKLKGVKCVWTAHNISHHDNKFPLVDALMTQFIAKFSDGIIAHCEFAKQQIIQKCNLKNSSKVSVIPHGNYIDCYDNTISAAAARAVLGISKDSLTLLFMGIIRPNKGIYDLIDAFEAVDNSKLHLIVAGKPYPGEEKIIESRLSQHLNTTFVPEYVPDDKIQLYMNAADVVVFPYKSILTSGAVVLAMSYGRACIAPRLGCMAETIDDGLGGYLYDPDDSQGLEEVLKKVVNCHDQLAEMGLHNRQKSALWNWDVIAQMTLEVYQRCL
jgi:beta-1,4-mannosyltransferase